MSRGPVDFLGPRGALAQALPGYEHRPQQMAMAEAVARALDGATPLLVEAGTGTGKTLAYLVPALLSGRKVVVSTGTRNLQEQIFERDVPFLAAHLGRPFQAAVLKGTSNYLCRRLMSGMLPAGDPDLERIAAWAQQTVTGDRAELTELADDAPAWRLVTVTPDLRLGPRCPFYDSCFVTRARRLASQADLVIVNHHLYLADVALRTSCPGAGILPEHEAVVFDEAHQLEDIATEHFSISASTLRLASLLRDTRQVLASTDLLGAASSEPVAKADRVAAEKLAANLESRGQELFGALRSHLSRLDRSGEPDDDPGRERRVATPDDLFEDEHRRPLWFKVDAALEELAAHASRRADAEDLEDARAVARRAESFRTDLASVAEPSSRYVRWAEVRGRSVFLHASPVDVGPMVRERIVEPLGAAIFTSATLTTSGSFAYVRERLGLNLEVSEELAVDSPFDYARQALLYLPQDLPEPRDPGFLPAALDRILELTVITAGRAFVLFTSHRSLRIAATELRRRLPFPVLVQGDAPRTRLLDSFRQNIGSVLLATTSFWEGVDVPGEALSLVILEKLPFAVPDDPITAARVRRAEERGEDAFATYQLPRAALALKQGFGRLIRRKDDRGIVAILDHRILRRAYGRVFLASLPPATRTSALEQVHRFW